MTVFERLKEKIKKELGFDCYAFERVFLTNQQRYFDGASTWVANIKDSITTVGSQQTATDLLKCKSLDYMVIRGEIDIFEKEEE